MVFRCASWDDNEPRGGARWRARAEGGGAGAAPAHNFRTTLYNMTLDSRPLHRALQALLGITTPRKFGGRGGVTARWPAP